MRCVAGVGREKFTDGWYRLAVGDDRNLSRELRLSDHSLALAGILRGEIFRDIVSRKARLAMEIIVGGVGHGRHGP